MALVGFGFDSAIEVTASPAAQWRLRVEQDAVRERGERVTSRIIGITFLALAVYDAYDSLESLWLRERPESSTVGIVILALSVVIMPVFGAGKAAGRGCNRKSRSPS